MKAANRVALILVGALLTIGPAALSRQPAVDQRAERHRVFLQEGVPLEYRSRRSPYPAATMVIRDGEDLYRQHCAACHGVNGQGDGEAGKDLTPPPALLAQLIKRRRSIDEYLLWTISEGGKRFGSDMPAFKATLDDNEIWQIVTYMRSGFLPLGEAGRD